MNNLAFRLPFSGQRSVAAAFVMALVLILASGARRASAVVALEDGAPHKPSTETATAKAMDAASTEAKALGPAQSIVPVPSQSFAPMLAPPDWEPAPFAGPVMGPAEAGPAGDMPAAPLALSYAVVFDGDAPTSPTAPENVTFAPRQRYRLLVTPNRAVYLYLVKEDAEGRFSMLHPAPGIISSVDRLAPGRPHVVPLNAWYQITSEKGAEKIHIVASANRVEWMEALVEKGVGGTGDSEAIQAALKGARDEAGAIRVEKRASADSSVLTAQGALADRAILVGFIDLRFPVETR